MATKVNKKELSGRFKQQMKENRKEMMSRGKNSDQAAQYQQKARSSISNDADSNPLIKVQDIAPQYLNPEVFGFVDRFLQAHPSFDEFREEEDREKIIEMIDDLLTYNKGMRPKLWYKSEIDAQAIKTTKHKHQMGLIFSKRGDEVIMIFSGGHRDRSCIEKVKQEIGRRPKDPGRIFIQRLVEDDVPNPQEYIESCRYVVFSPKEKITSKNLDLIKCALYAFMNVRYSLRDIHMRIVMEIQAINAFRALGTPQIY